MSSKSYKMRMYDKMVLTRRVKIVATGIFLWSFIVTVIVLAANAAK